MEIKYKTYPAYKDSGVDWLGEIPKSWDFIANKYIFKIKKNQVGKKSIEYDLLSLTLNGVIKRDMINPEGKFPAEFDTYQEVKRGDFIFCLFDVEETPRTVGYSDFDGMITGAYTVMKPRNTFDSKFLFYFYLNLDKDKRLRPLYRGLRNTIPKESFFSFKTFIPAKEEQTAIANFLDNKTTKINQAIAQKQKLIELLKERKQILIQNAVTRGIDENGNIRQKPKCLPAEGSPEGWKDSGVEWIGEIPEHWEVKKLDNMLKPYSIKNRPDEKLLSITRELGVIERDTEDLESNHNFIPDDLSSYKLLRKNDFGMNKMKAWQGSFGVSNFTGIVSPAYYTFKIVDDVKPEFFHVAIRSKFYVPLFGQASDGVRIGQWDLSKDRMKKIPFAVPYRVEQSEIVSYIETQSTKIDNAIALQQTQIEKLKEYKSVLIDSAVTGKIKVS